MRHKLSLSIFVLVALLLFDPKSAFADDQFLPIIDAHSQINARMDFDKLVSILKKGKVSRVILSSLPRRILKPKKLFELVSRHPDLIVPAIMAKGRGYDRNAPRWYSRIERHSSRPRFKGIGEAHLYHAAKGRAEEVTVFPGDPRIKHLLKIVKNRNWPLVLHAEFKAGGNIKNRMLKELGDLMNKNPKQAFVLTHMGQLEADEVRILVSKHSNIFFITSHSNHIFIGKSGRGGRPSRQPWVDMFNGDQLDSNWRRLIIAHPNRFVLGFDNTRVEYWSELYIDQINLWRNALAKLPRPVAEAVAHKNAERLWRLPPAK